MSEEERKACQECGKEPATVHLTEFIDGRPVKIDLGEECYGKKEGVPPLPQSGIPPEIIRTIPELIKELIKKEPETDHLTVILHGRPVKIVLRERTWTSDVVFGTVPASRSATRAELRRDGDDKSGEAGSGQRG